MLYFSHSSLNAQTANSLAQNAMIFAFKKRRCKTIVISPIKNSKSRFLQKIYQAYLILKAVFFTFKNNLGYSRNIVYVFLCVIFGQASVLEQHFLPNKKTKLAVRMMFSFLLKRNINIVVISHSLKTLLETNYKVRANLIVAHSGAHYDPSHTKTNYKKIEKIGYTGSFLKGRGLDEINQLAKIHFNLEFHLYGGTRAQFSKLLDTEVRENIHIYGYVSNNEILKILPTLDLLLAPYEKKVSVSGGSITTESYMSPLKIFEYLASGTPLLTASHPPICEIISDNENGFLYGFDGSNTIFKRFEEILKLQISDVKKIGSNGKREIVEKFNWDLRVENIKNALT